MQQKQNRHNTQPTRMPHPHPSNPTEPTNENQQQQDYKESTVQPHWKQRQQRKKYRKQIFGEHYNYDYKRPNQHKLYRIQQNKNTEIERANRILLQKIQAIFKRSMGKKKNKQIQISEVVSTSELTHKPSQPQSVQHMKHLRTNINEEIQSKLSNKSKTNRKSLKEEQFGSLNKNIQMAKNQVNGEDDDTKSRYRGKGDGNMNRNLVKLQQLEQEVVNKRKRIQTQTNKQSPKNSIYPQPQLPEQPHPHPYPHQKARKAITSNSEQSPTPKKPVPKNLPPPNSSRIILMKSSAMVAGKHYRLQAYIESSTYILSAKSLRNGQEYHQLITMPSRHYQELYRVKLQQNHQGIVKELVVDQEQGLLQVKGFRSEFRDIYDYGEVIIDPKKQPQPQQNSPKQQTPQSQRKRSRSKDIIVHFSSYQNGDDISDRITYTQSQYDQQKLQAKTFEEVPLTMENNNNKNKNERVNKIKSRNNNSRTSENVLRGEKESKKVSRNQNNYDGDRTRNQKQDQDLDYEKLKNSIVNQYQVVVQSPNQSRILKASGVSKRQNKMSTNIVSIQIQPQHKHPYSQKLINNLQSLQPKISQSHSQPIATQATNFQVQQLKQIPESELSEEVSERVFTKQLKTKKSTKQNQWEKSKIKEVSHKQESPQYQDEEFQLEEYEQKIKEKEKSINMRKEYNPYKQEQYQDMEVIQDNS